MTFTSHMPGTANRLHPNGDKIVDVVTLDEKQFLHSYDCCDAAD